MSYPNGTKISMGKRSGDLAGQGSVGQARNQTVETIAVCERALSC